MTKIEFVDQTMRDGQQSLWGIRMRAYQAARALPHIDRTGFRVVDALKRKKTEKKNRTFCFARGN